jgi:hypothetical protein
MNRRPPSLIALSLIALIAAPGAAEAGHQQHRKWVNDPSVGYAVPLQRVYQFPASIVDQPTSPVGYAVPLQRIYQFPASIVGQPGAIDPFTVGAPAPVW